jgi:hypothetical protein
MKAEVNTKFELREKVYAVRGGRIHYGEIAEIHLSANRIHREWVVHYDLQDAIYNIPERAIYRTMDEAEKALRNN